MKQVRRGLEEGWQRVGRWFDIFFIFVNQYTGSKIKRMAKHVGGKVLKKWFTHGWQMVSRWLADGFE